MTATIDSTVHLDRTDFLRLANAAGSTVVCLEGYLWLTRDGFEKDVQLEPGQSYRLEDAGRFIVNGLEPSVARVLRPAPERWRALRPLFGPSGWVRRLAFG